MGKTLIGTPDKCYVCGKTEGLHRHHIFYGKNRRKCEEYGLCCKLCYEHHEGNTGVHRHPNTGLDLKLKQLAQTYYEEHYGDREKFISEFVKSYL